MTPAPGKSFDPTAIPKAVKDAGFTPGPIEVTAAGKLGVEDDMPVLEMAGPLRRFVLAGGAKAEELKGRGDLRGKQVRVRGRLHPSHGDKPPGLTVESFEAVSGEAGAAKALRVETRKPGWS